MTFKEELQTSLIPRVEVMIEKEKLHLESLKALKTRIEGFPWWKRPFFTTEHIEDFILNSEISLKGLNKTLIDYTNYAK